jgi:hypothetical protein
MKSAVTLSESHYANERQTLKTRGIFQNAKMKCIEVITNIFYCQNPTPLMIGVSAQDRHSKVGDQARIMLRPRSESFRPTPPFPVLDLR